MIWDRVGVRCPVAWGVWWGLAFPRHEVVMVVDVVVVDVVVVLVMVVVMVVEVEAVRRIRAPNK
jgi:hypothetical protein